MFHAKILRSHWHNGDVIVLIDCYVSSLWITYGIGRFGRLITSESFSLKSESGQEVRIILPEEVLKSSVPKIILNARVELFL
jgi:hypothetical protein